MSYEYGTTLESHVPTGREGVTVGFQPGSVVVSPSWLADHRQDATIVDVRPAHEYEQLGHVPGAVNVSYERLRDPSSVMEGTLPTPEVFGGLLGEAGISPTDPLVAYDGDRGVYAARLLLTAAVFGHEGSLHLLDGDFGTWQANWEPTTTAPDREAVAYDAHLTDDAPIVDRATVEAAIEGEPVLVDTRTPAEYANAHIPGAIQLSWERLIDEETGRLNPPDELETRLADRGLTPDRELILYCNTARRLSHTFVVLAHLGYEHVRFYEGSLTDWVRATADQWDPTGLVRDVRTFAPDGIDALVDARGDDVLNRLKLVGLYHQKQSGYFMLRTKIPAGRLTADQVATIAEVGDRFARAPPEYGGREQNPLFGDGYLDLTTRQDVQMHWIRLEDVPEIWDRYDAVGLTTMQACGNSIRNVVACPAAGIDQHEVFDVGEIADRITDRFLADRKYANLPRKFKVSVTGCRENCARAQINDLGLTPAVKDGRDGFTVLVGGGLSDGPRMASDLGIFVRADQVVELIEAAADVFIESGSYLDTAVNRFRFVVEELGPETVRDELADRVSFELYEPDELLTTDYRGDHVGVHEQPNGRRYVGLNVPTGRMRAEEFRRIGELAGTYGDGALRLTLNQNVLVPNVSRDRLPALLEEPILELYSPHPGPFTRGIVACTGSEYCNYGIIETKARALGWAQTLDAWVADEWDDPPPVIRMHLSGCSASCAQPQIADIGLRGEITRDERRGELPAVDVGLGGDLGREQFVDWVAGAMPVEELPPAVRALLMRYNEEREATAQSFTDWLAETDQATLHEALSPPEVTP